MKQNEINCLNLFLNKLDESFSSSGCNDWEMPNTPENLELLKAAHRWNVKENELNYSEEYNTWIKKYEEVDLLNHPIFPTIWTSDYILFGFLRYKLKSSITVEN